MSGMPSTGGDFNARLQAALSKAKTAAAAPTGGASIASPAPGTPVPADEFSNRIADAMRRASGQVPQGEPAPTPDTQSGGPVGEGERVVRQGDCVASIAVSTGHFWETIWNDPANADLQLVRKDPYVLLPGDRVTIPALRRKEESIAAEQRHRFKRKGCPEKLIVFFRDGGEPRGNQRYILVIDGQETEGTTEATGRVEIFIPPDARRGVVYFPDSDDAYELDLGYLDPVSELTGVQGRLRNLGFFQGQLDGKPSPLLDSAVRAFQVKCSLEPTGEIDADTRAKLLEIHGS